MKGKKQFLRAMTTLATFGPLLWILHTRAEGGGGDKSYEIVAGTIQEMFAVNLVEKTSINQISATLFPSHGCWRGVCGFNKKSDFMLN